MKFLILSDAGDSLGLGLRIKAEGNEVLFWIRRDSGENVGNNLVQKNIEKLGSFSPDVVIADCTGFGTIMDMYSKLGIACLGGSTLMDNLEMDRKFATEIMVQCGLKVPKSKTFSSFEEATAFIQDKKNSDKRFVFKPSGSDSGNVPSFVSKDSESLIKMFDKYKKILSGNLEFDLQEFHEGIDISTEIWFSKGEPIYDTLNHTLETKHLMDGDLGPSGGCTGNVIWKAEESLLTNESIEKMFDFCKEQEYTGPLDVNSIICDDGIYALEFTPRFGYDATPTMLCTLLEGEISGFLAGVAKGEREVQSHSGELFRHKGFGAGVKLSLNPWPFEEGHTTGSVPLKIKEKQLVDGPFFPYNLQMNEEDEIETCNAYGMVGIAMGFDNKIDDAIAQCLKIAKKINVPDLQYRSDLGEVFTKRYNKVGKMLSNLS